MNTRGNLGQVNHTLTDTEIEQILNAAQLNKKLVVFNNCTFNIGKFSSLDFPDDRPAKEHVVTRNPNGDIDQYKNVIRDGLTVLLSRDFLDSAEELDYKRDGLDVKNLYIKGADGTVYLVIGELKADQDYEFPRVIHKGESIYMAHIIDEIIETPKGNINLPNLLSQITLTYTKI